MVESRIRTGVFLVEGAVGVVLKGLLNPCLSSCAPPIRRTGSTQIRGQHKRNATILGGLPSLTPYPFGYRFDGVRYRTRYIAPPQAMDFETRASLDEWDGRTCLFFRGLLQNYFTLVNPAHHQF